jgi:two-component system, OmpR family, phosphate regulon sensor histidine kinase PhoR
MLGINAVEMSFITAFLILETIILLIIIGEKRNIELQNINSVIRSIRMDEYSSPDEIKLDGNLQGVQEEIKSMFLRTMNDIENLKHLGRVRTEFLGNVSHELRTPIFAIQGYLETLLDGAIDDKKVNKGFLEKAIHHSQNLNNLLNDLIDISMIESGEMRLSFRYFNIFEFLQQVIHEHKPQADKKNLQLILQPVRDDLQVFGDKSKLKQVFDNLVQNSIKYTEEGKVEIIIVEQDKYAEIIVRDTGIGIPRKELNRIFERFYRVDKDRSRTVGGTGLGLAIVKHIVEAHNSKVIVESDLGKGSQFSFKLKK